MRKRNNGTHGLVRGSTLPLIPYPKREEAIVMSAGVGGCLRHGSMLSRHVVKLCFIDTKCSVFFYFLFCKS